MPGFRGHTADAQSSLRATQCDTGISDRASYSVTVPLAANRLLPNSHQRWEATCEADDTTISALSSWEITKSIRCPEGFQLTAAHTCFLHQGCSPSHRLVFPSRRTSGPLLNCTHQLVAFKTDPFDFKNFAYQAAFSDSQQVAEFTVNHS